MSKLREKFVNAIKHLRAKEVDKCEQIADDLAVKFAPWVEDMFYLINKKYYNKEDAYWNAEGYTITELLQIFKDKYYEQ